jgi:Flp pilus assembly pilin Flp
MPLPPALKVSLSSAVPCITGLSLTPKGKGVVMAKNISTQDSSARLKAQRGAGLIEYALLISLISFVAIGTLPALGTAIAMRFEDTAHALAGSGFECNPNHPDYPDC